MEYNPNITQQTIGDTLSDRFLGTNKRGEKAINNQYEMSKAETINKYEWNKQGMVQAGINPLAAGASIGASPTQAPQAQQQGEGDPISSIVLPLMDKVIGVVGKIAKIK